MQRCTRDLKKEMEKTRTCPNLVTHSYPKFELSTWNGFVNKQTYNIAMLIAFSSIARSLSGTTNIIKSYLTRDSGRSSHFGTFSFRFYAR